MFWKQQDAADSARSIYPSIVAVYSLEKLWNDMEANATGRFLHLEVETNDTKTKTMGDGNAAPGPT